METIFVGNTTLTFNRIYYVDTTAGSDSNDGSKNKPFRNMPAAIGACVSGDAIYLKGWWSGNDLNFGAKNISVIGNYLKDNSRIIARCFGNSGSYPNVSFYNLYLQGPGGAGWTEQFYYINASVYNCIYQDPSGYSCVYGTYKFYNCLILAMASPYSGATFTNCAFVNSVLGTSVNCLGGVKYDGTFKLTSSGWQNTGTGTYYNGTTTHIGLYGGIYAFSDFLGDMPSIGGKTTFHYTGKVQTWVNYLPYAVLVKLECYGAKGGGVPTRLGGKGGYAQGNFVVQPGETINVYVGQQGNTPTSGNVSGGWNGGGSGGPNAGSGGGATDMRLLGQSLSDRIIVAGGGGGMGNNGGAEGGDGGGFIGGYNTVDAYPGSFPAPSIGGTQTRGGILNVFPGYWVSGGSGGDGSLGQGGNGAGYKFSASPQGGGTTTGTTGSGGGGGYYGGGGGSYGGAGGGSSYIAMLSDASTVSGGSTYSDGLAYITVLRYAEPIKINDINISDAGTSIIISGTVILEDADECEFGIINTSNNTLLYSNIVTESFSLHAEIDKTKFIKNELNTLEISDTSSGFRRVIKSIMFYVSDEEIILVDKFVTLKNIQLDKPIEQLYITTNHLGATFVPLVSFDYGNSWNKAKLNELYDITPSSEIKIKFLMSNDAEIKSYSILFVPEVV